MKPWDANWKQWKSDYATRSFDSYFCLSRREGVLAATERFQSFNIWARFIPEKVISKFLSWYSCSKLGWFSNGRSLKDILFNWK